MLELGDRNIIACYKYYLSFIPSEGPFYQTPSKHMSSIQPSFTKQVVGRNTLNGLVQNICSKAGLEGNFTEHSGKVTCATELFNNMIDEQLIQIQTAVPLVSGVIKGLVMITLRMCLKYYNHHLVRSLHVMI